MSLLSNLLKRDSVKEQHEVIEDEIISIVSEGAQSGLFQENEVKMISNIFSLDDKEASDIATDRSKIVGIEIDTKIKDVMNIMLNNSFSRYPVYEEDLDHIVGILHLKDAVKAMYETPKNNFSLKEKPSIIMDAVVVPETKALDALFRQMQSSKTQMVVVVDEYGQTSGIVAMEDILEEIVGNIQDEYDDDEQLIVSSKDNMSYEIAGMTELTDVEEELGISFGETNFDTLNGFLISKLEHIPESDELFEIEYEGYRFNVTEIEDKCVKTVVVTKVEENPQDMVEL